MTGTTNPQFEIQDTKLNAQHTGSQEQTAAARGTQETQIPRWQQISGITAAKESQLSEDERDSGIRKLIAEVERLANEQFARGEKVPAGERTVLWDPLEKICRRLEISRTKLSALSRELTGMRAHEITDRIKAKDLIKKVYEHAVNALYPELEALKKEARPAGMSEKYYGIHLVQKFWRILKDARFGVAKARWAAELGFANPHRLARACLLAHGMSIEEVEGRAVSLLVQKFLAALPKMAAPNAAEQAAQMKAAAEKKVAEIIAKSDRQREEIARQEDEIMEECAAV